MTNQASQGRGSLIIATVLISIGIVSLFGQVFNIDLGQYLWPFFIIVPGLMFFAGMVLGGPAAGPLAIPGSIVTMVGLLLLYQNTFDHFESWAYAWSLIFPTSVGVGLIIGGGWSKNDKMIRTGMGWAGVGVAIFILFGLFFEVILDISGSGVSDVVWPLILIGLGLFLFTRRGGGKQPAESVPASKFNGKPVEMPPQPSEPQFEPLDMTRSRK